MQPWIVQLGQVALERNPGAAEPSSGWGELPEELAALYRAMDGALLPGEVRLFGTGGIAPGGPALEFGRKGEGQRLLAVRRRDVYPLAGEGVVPAWVEALEPDAWLFALAGEPGALRLYRTLERMLEVIVPPQVKEEFGEHTFVRALSAVQDALGALRPEAPAPELAPPAPRRVVPARLPKAKKAAPARAAKPKRKQAPAKSGGKKGVRAKPAGAAAGRKQKPKPKAKTAKPASGRKQASARGAKASKAKARLTRSSPGSARRGR